MNIDIYENIRLPKNVYPENYQLYIKPNLENFTFDGEVKITVILNKYDKPYFVIHSKNLNIISVLIDNHNVSFTINEKNELLFINCPHDPNLVSTHVLLINFSGYINTDLKGFYRSKYVSNGIEKYIATTQFEPTDARQAFPCFDEPNFKATFDIAITAPKNKTVLSNSYIKKTINKNTEDTYIFKTTPKMSTYLVAFIIGDFEYIEKYNKNNVRIRVYGIFENLDKLNFALDVCTKSLDWYEDWFGIRYPLQKLDLIGIPDFDAGAMENWGLITFRPELLCCTNETELEYKQNIVITICHELAHQWFGNLVTMEWWTYLWLNESMATYFGWWVCDELFPEWNIWNKFIESEYNYALNLDSLEASHPIEIKIKKTKDINQIFDGISYSKGACLIRFLVNYLGNEIFRKGMYEYLTMNAYKNATSKNLWDAFDKVLLETPFIMNNNLTNISSMMNLWIKQTGYPIVTLFRNKETNKYMLKQNKYIKTGPNKNDNTKWSIPIKIYYNDTYRDVVLSDSDIIISESEISESDIIIINPNRIGFYRVQYDETIHNFQLLSKTIQKQIISDGFAIALSGYQGLTNVFKLLNQINLFTLKEYELWSTILSNITLIKKLMIRNDSITKLINNYIYNNILIHVKSLLNEIGLNDMENESVNNSDLRPLLIEFLTLMGDDDIINHTKICFSKNQYKYILKTVGKYSNKIEYDKLLELLETNENPQLKDELLYAIGAAINQTLIDNTINNVLLSKVREQDLHTMIYNLVINENATDKIWNYVTTNWDKILDIYKPGSSGLSHTVKVLSYGFYNQEELNKYETFFNIRPEGTNMVINQSIESLKSRIYTIHRIENDDELKLYI